MSKLPKWRIKRDAAKKYGTETPDFKTARDMLDANPVSTDSKVLGAGLVELYPGGPKVRVDGK